MARNTGNTTRKRLRNSRGHETFRKVTAGLTETEVAEALSTEGLTTSQSSVSRWKTWLSTPDWQRQRRIQEVYPRVRTALWADPLPVPVEARGRAKS